MDNSLNQTELWPGWETVCLLGRGNSGSVYEIRKPLGDGWEYAAARQIPIPMDPEEIQELLDNGRTQEQIDEMLEERLHSVIENYRRMLRLKDCKNLVQYDDLRFSAREDAPGWDIIIRMELLHPLGQSLHPRLAEEQAIWLGVDLCRALTFCHAQNELHRNIRARSVFVGEDGSCKLGKFQPLGAAGENAPARTGYRDNNCMAPELSRGEPYSPATDQYSLGMLLYWILNERRFPFLPLPPAIPTLEQRFCALGERLAGKAFPGPAHGSEALKRIVMRACAFDPKERYADVSEMLRDLEELKKADGLLSSPFLLSPEGIEIKWAPEHVEWKLPIQKETKRGCPWARWLVPPLLILLLVLLFGPKRSGASRKTAAIPAQIAADSSTEKAGAETYQRSADGLLWAYHDGVLRIKGSGAMQDYRVSGDPEGEILLDGRPWGTYLPFIKQIQIDEGVTEIGDNAFAFCLGVQEIRLPSGVTRIGIGAFSYCLGLRYAELPESLEKVETDAFYQCKNLEEAAFLGTEEQRQKLEIGEGNAALARAMGGTEVP